MLLFNFVLTDTENVSINLETLCDVKDIKGTKTRESEKAEEYVKAKGFVISQKKYLFLEELTNWENLREIK